jgi:hypothetical protein
LTWLKCHAGLAELEFHGVWKMSVDSCSPLFGEHLPKGCRMTVMISVSRRDRISRYTRSIKYKVPATNSHRQPSYPIQCVQNGDPAKGDRGSTLSRTKQPVACVYMASRNGTKRWCVYQNVSKDCFLILACAVVNISSMQRSIMWPVIPPGCV